MLFKLNHEKSLFFSLLFIFNFVLAQSQVDFTKGYLPLESMGKVPEVLTISASSKYQEQVEVEISDYEKKRLKKTKDEFYLNSNYQVDHLIKGGAVNYGDEISLYLQEIMDKILQKNGLAKKHKNLEIFLLKSPLANAFSTDQGVIFFTTGLFSRLNSEGQVAFILCHELVHYLEKHNVNSYVKKSELKRNGRRYSRGQIIEQLSAYSHEHEYEADGEGFDLFRNLDYPLEEATNALGILRHSGRSIFLGDVDIKFFNTEFMTVPAYLFLEGLAYESNEEDEENDNVKIEARALSTHPELEDRIKALEDKMSLVTSKDQGPPLRSQAKFQELRTLAHFESLEQMMRHFDYSGALFEAYQLKNQYPENEYLDRVIVHAIYGIAKYGGEYESPTWNLNDNGIENLIDQTSGQHWLGLALKTSCENYNKTSNLEYLKIVDDVIFQILSDTAGTKENYSEGSNEEGKWYYNGLAHLDNKQFFLDRFDTITQEVEDAQRREEALKTKSKRKKSGVGRFYNFRVGDLDDIQTNELLIYSPQATEITRNSLDLIKSEQLQTDMNSSMNEAIDMLGINADLLSKDNLGRNDTEKINQMNMIFDYLNEVFEFVEYKKVPYTRLSPDVQNMVDNKAVLFVSLTEGQRYRFHMGSFYKLIAIYSIPDIIGKIIWPERRVYYENLLIDLNKRELLYYESQVLNGRHSRGQMSHKYYNLLYNIKH